MIASFASSSCLCSHFVISLMLKDSTFIASPMLEILSQIEIKLNWLPMSPFLLGDLSEKFQDSVVAKKFLCSTS